MKLTVPLGKDTIKERWMVGLAGSLSRGKFVLTEDVYLEDTEFMIDRVLIDALKFKAKPLAQRWAALIREAPQLKHYNMLENDTLFNLNESIFFQLARFLEHGLDRSVLGDYFVRMGKNSVHHGFPLSETVYGLRISQQVIMRYMEGEFVLDDPVALYQALSVSAKVSDFFLLGCFYINKGFQEATIEKMSENDKLPRAMLTKYFKDDFFFKKE
jgi:hypothetical protein